MIEMNPSQPQLTESLLDKLVEQVCDRIQAGEMVQLKSLIDQYPEMADRLRRIYPTLLAMANWNQLDSSDPLIGGDTEEQETNQSIGDFRIIRQIGRGGMGIVYEAEQLSVRRLVALKILPLASLIQENALLRFQNEVRAAATLDHPHIVTVHSVGEERGIHYYAMQLIRGQSLAAVVRALREVGHKTGSIDGQSISQIMAHDDVTELSQAKAEPIPQDRTQAETRARADSQTIDTKFDPAFFSNVARLGIQAAKALGHAHDHGVIHRDVKPGNLLLDKHGSLFVTDFGLARIEADPSVTLTGDVLGTLRYMSPEQLQAKPNVVDLRTDVYSLGATLYELLTLEPMWSGKDRAQVIRRISSEEPARPQQINPAIPTDLETIVLKAVSKEPADRYDSAWALADDLQRLLDLKPIVARPPTTLQRITKWSQRHPGVMWGVSLMMLMLTIGFAVSAGLIWSANNKTRIALFQSKQNFSEAQRQTDRAERNLDRALKAVDDFLWRVGESQLANIPQSDQLRKKLLEDAQALCQSFIDAEADDPRVRLRSAKASASLGSILIELGDDEAAQLTINRAVAELENWIKQYPEHESVGEAKQSLAGSFLNLGNLYLGLTQYDQAARKFQTALDMQQELSAMPGNSDKPKNRLLRGMGYRSLATALHQLNRFSEAETASRQAIKSLTSLVERYPEDPDYRVKLGWAYQGLGISLDDLQDRKNALANYEQAISILRQWSDKSADVPWAKSTLGGVLRNCARLIVLIEAHPNAKQLDQADALLTESISIFRELNQQFPNFPEYRSSLQTSYLNLSGIYRERGDFAEAADLLEQAVSIQRLLVDEFPQRPDYRSELAKLLSDLNSYLVSSGQNAGGPLKESIEILQRLVQDFPDVADYRNSLVMGYRNVGLAHHGNGRLDSAETAFQKAISIASQLVEDYPATVHYRLQLSVVHDSLGTVYLGLDQPEQALEQYHQALMHCKELIRNDPENVSNQEQLSSIQFNLAVAHAALGDLETAEPIFKQDILLKAKLVKQSPADARYKYNLAISHGSLAKCYENTDRLALAADQFEIALQLLREVLDGPDAAWRPDATREIARNFGNLIRTHRKIGDTDKAVSVLTEAANTVSEFLDHEPTNQQLMQSVANIAAAARNLDQAEQARLLLQHGVDTAKRTLGAEHWITLAFINDVGLSNQQLRDWQAAMNCYQLVIETREKMHTENPADAQNSWSLGGAYCNRANVRKSNDDMDEAIAELFDELVFPRSKCSFAFLTPRVKKYQGLNNLWCHVRLTFLTPRLEQKTLSCHKRWIVRIRWTKINNSKL